MNPAARAYWSRIDIRWRLNADGMFMAFYRELPPLRMEMAPLARHRPDLEPRTPTSPSNAPLPHRRGDEDLCELEPDALKHPAADSRVALGRAQEAPLTPHPQK